MYKLPKLVVKVDILCVSVVVHDAKVHVMVELL